MESNLLDWALKYAERGYPVFPIHSVREGKCSCGNPSCGSVGKHPRTHDGFKSATTDTATIRKWWGMWPDANIGLPTGALSGLVVVDADSEAGIRLVEERLKPNTITSKTGKGLHYIYKAPEKRLKNRTKFWEGVDLRAEGGYIVVPSSLHSSGKHYEWINDLTEGTPAEMPDWLVQELDAPSRKSGHPNVFTNEPTFPSQFWESVPAQISEGGRNDTLFRIAGKLRHWGLEDEAIFSALQAINKERCVPALPDHEVRSIASSIERYPAGNPNLTELGALGLEELTDLGNARRLVAKHGHRFKYCKEMKKWLIWIGYKWDEDKIMEIEVFAKDVVKHIADEHSQISDKTLREKLFKHAVRSESERSIDAMIKLARSESEVATRPESFDKDLYRFHVKNGFIDLKTGDFMPPDSSLLNSKVADLEYDSQAKCPEWDRFLNKIMGGDAAVIKYLQKAIGYSLTGSTDEQIMFVLHGTGANGKSTFINTIMKIFGDYAMQTPTSTLLAKNQSYISNDLARLHGTRLVAASEANEGQRLDESLIKQMTGGDRISARFLHREFFEFTPTHKIFLITNHLPEIHGTEKAIWRRIRKIPFEVTIADHEIDKQLPQRLLLEASGILNWALEGCRLWQQEGLIPPKRVVLATDEYRGEMDVIERFIKERCILDGSSRISAGVLYASLKDWLQKNSEGDIASNKFSYRMEEKGYEKKREQNRKVYWGIRLKTDEEEVDCSPPRLDE